MDICKVLDMNPGLEMSSWGTLHFPEEKRIIEWLIQVENTQWKATRFERCKRAPEGGFAAIREGHQALLDEWFRNTEGKIRLQMICKEDVSEEQAIRLVMSELQKAGYPEPLKDEAASLRRMFKFCRTPAKTQVFRRFQVD